LNRRTAQDTLPKIGNGKKRDQRLLDLVLNTHTFGRCHC
jgi:hypothetical protein